MEKFIFWLFVGGIMWITILALFLAWKDTTQLVCYHEVDWVNKTTIVYWKNTSLSLKWNVYCYLERPWDSLYKVNRQIVETFGEKEDWIYTFNKI